MSITVAPTTQRIAQSIDNLRITDEEFKIKTEECLQLRAQLQESQRNNERLQLLLRKQENISASAQDEAMKTKHALDVVLKELMTKHSTIDALQLEVGRLKRDLESSQRHAGEVAKTLKFKSLSSQVVTGLGEPSTMYVEQCLRAGCNTHPDVVRGLHDGQEIVAVENPITFQQLNALCEVLEMVRTMDPLNKSYGLAIKRLAIAVQAEESLVLVAQLIRTQTTIHTVELHGLGAYCASEIAAALATSEHVTTVAFPSLQVNDVALQALLKVVNNREQLYVTSKAQWQQEIDEAAAAKNDALVQYLTDAGPKHALLKLSSLDLSQSDIQSSKTFELIRGIAMQSINLSGNAFVQDHDIGEILRGCPHLESVDFSHCTQLSNDTVTYINAAQTVVKVNLLGCRGVSKINFFFVQTLITDLTGVAHLTCSSLTSLPVPLTHFSLVAFQCPVLDEMTLRGLTLCDRELRMIAESSPNLTKLHFIKCRLSGADYFFRVMRKLKDLSLHGCKGVTDTEVTCLCSQLQKLDLTDAYCLTDRSVLYLAERCSALTHLTLKRCANLTDQGMNALLDHPTLEHINMLGTKKITIVALHRVLSTMPSLRAIVHETYVSSTVQVDRDDAEEVERTNVEAQQAALVVKREGVAFTYLTSPALQTSSPTRSRTALDSAANSPIVPRPPTADAAGSVVSPHGRSKRESNTPTIPSAATPDITSAAAQGENEQQQATAVRSDSALGADENAAQSTTAADPPTTNATTDDAVVVRNDNATTTTGDVPTEVNSEITAL